MDDSRFTELKEATAEFICAGMKKAKSPDDIAALIREVYARSEPLAEKIDKTTEASMHIDCHKGCGACCVVNVGLLLPEAVSIAKYLQEEGADRWEKSRDDLNELYRHIRWLDADERVALHKRCAFLDDEGVCTIYPVRPFMCRSVTSTSAATCREALAMQALGEKPLVIMNLRHKQLFESLMHGVEEGLKRAGKEARQFEMTAALVAIMLDPERVGIDIT